MFASIAVTIVVGSHCAALQRWTEETGQPISDADLAEIDALVAYGETIIAEERTRYEDAGLLPVYPLSRPTHPPPPGPAVAWAARLPPSPRPGGPLFEAQPMSRQAQWSLVAAVCGAILGALLAAFVPWH